MVESLAQERGDDRHVHAQAVLHLTGNGCHFHMSLWKDGENVFEADPRDDPRGLGPVRGRLPLHRRAEGARQGLHRASPRRRSRSYKRLVVGTRSGSSWAPVYVSYGYNNRTQMLRIPAAGPDRGPHGRRLVQPLPRRGGDAGRRPRRDRARARPGRADHRAQPARADRGAARRARRRAAAGQPARRDARAGAGRRAAQGARHDRREDYVDYFVRVKQREFEEWHNQVTPVGGRPLPARLF